MEGQRASLFVYRMFIPSLNDTSFPVNNHHSNLVTLREILDNQTVALLVSLSLLLP